MAEGGEQTASFENPGYKPWDDDYEDDEKAETKHLLFYQSLLPLLLVDKKSKCRQ